MSCTNTDATPRVISLFIAASAAAPGVADTIVKSKTLQPNETWVPYQALGAVLSPAGTIQAIADAPSVVVLKASGIELTT